MVLLHQRHDLSEGCVLRDRERRRAHDLRNPASVLVDEIGGGLPRPKDKPKPASTPAPGAYFGPADEVSFGNHADELARSIDYRQAADMALQHDSCRLHNGGIGSDCDDRAGHDLMGTHWKLRYSRASPNVTSLDENKLMQLNWLKVARERPWLGCLAGL